MVVTSPDAPKSKEDISSPEMQAPQSSAANKCALCSKRFAVKECSLTACTQCCTDESCERHKRLREQALWKERVIAGTTMIQTHAREKRSKLLKPGRFREPGFVYQGDTVVIWSLREYMRNPKWRDDALRKSNRRKARATDGMATEELAKKLSSRPADGRNRQQRFRQFMEEKYKASLEKSS